MTNEYEVGAYRLRELLPGSHSTFLAESKVDGSVVAVKTIIGAFGTREWGAVSDALSRPPPNIPGFCLVKEIGIRKELIYAVAPFLDGMNMQRAIKAAGQNRTVLEKKEHLGASALAMCTYAGAAEIAIRESIDCLRGHVFSAEEFFVARDGQVQMMDPRWVALRTLANQRRTNSLVHCLAYQLPDRFKPKSSVETDFVWGLSTMFWELCSGYRLFRRASLIETLHCLSEQTIISPSSLNAAIPEEIGNFVVHALKNPLDITLEELKSEFSRIARLYGAEAPQTLCSWVEELIPAECTFEEEDEDGGFSALEALLEDAGLTWTYSENSTTFVRAPPMGATDSDELYWLEDADLPLEIAIDYEDAPPPSEQVERPPSAALKVGAFVSLALLIAACIFSAPQIARKFEQKTNDTGTQGHISSGAVGVVTVNE